MRLFSVLEQFSYRSYSSVFVTFLFPAIFRERHSDILIKESVSLTPLWLWRMFVALKRHFYIASGFLPRIWKILPHLIVRLTLTILDWDKRNLLETMGPRCISWCQLCHTRPLLTEDVHFPFPPPTIQWPSAGLFLCPMEQRPWVSSSKVGSLQLRTHEPVLGGLLPVRLFIRLPQFTPI